MCSKGLCKSILFGRLPRPKRRLPRVHAAAAESGATPGESSAETPGCGAPQLETKLTLKAELHELENGHEPVGKLPEASNWKKIQLSVGETVAHELRFICRALGPKRTQAEVDQSWPKPCFQTVFWRHCVPA